MPANKLTIANQALQKIGSRAITSFLEDGSNEAVAINLVWEDILREVLSEFAWSFAQKRAALVPVVPDDVSRTIEERIFAPVSITAATADDPVMITAANHGLADGDRIKILGVAGMTELNGNFYVVASATRTTFTLLDQDTFEAIDGGSFTTYTSDGQIYLANDMDPLLITAATVANPVMITAPAHGFSNGDWIYIHGVKGMTELNGNFYIVAGATINTFTLTDTDGVAIDGSAYTAYVSGGQILEAIEMPQTDTGTIVVYHKPADLVKPTKKNDKNALISVEQDKIISNVENLKIKYTYLCKDATRYFPKFTQALSTRLASEIAFGITNSTTKSEALRKLYLDVDLPSACSVDSTQGTPDEADQDDWENVMMGGERFITNPNTWHPA
jgi:hypothetical protein